MPSRPGIRIFGKKKDWKGENDRYSKSKKADHGDNMLQPETFMDPVVYFTVVITTDIPPRTLTNGIRTEWEANGRGKLQVKDLQSQESKVVIALYFVYTGMPYHIILKTLNSILLDATSIKEYERMELEGDKEYKAPAPISGISICLQVPHLKGMDTSSYNKLPYHVRETGKPYTLKLIPTMRPV
jgi:hypothetical protein